MDFHFSKYSPLVRRTVAFALLLAAVAGCSRKKTLTSNLNIENKVEVFLLMTLNRMKQLI